MYLPPEKHHQDRRPLRRSIFRVSILTVCPRHHTTQYQMGYRSPSPATLQENWRYSSDRATIFPAGLMGAGYGRYATTPDMITSSSDAARECNEASNNPKSVSPSAGGTLVAGPPQDQAIPSPRPVAYGGF